MKPIILHEDAEAELAAAMAYYEGRRQGLGLEFQEAVQTVFEKICQMPQAFSLHDASQGSRRYVMRGRRAVNEEG